MKLHELKWLGFVLRMTRHGLSGQSMEGETGLGWERVMDDQTMRWHESTKSLFLLVLASEGGVDWSTGILGILRVSGCKWLKVDENGADVVTPSYHPDSVNAH